jgi:hypothetical protein
MPMADAFKSSWRRVKGEGFMGRMLSPSDLEHYQKRRAQRLLWRNLSSGRRRLLPEAVVSRESEPSRIDRRLPAVDSTDRGNALAKSFCRRLEAQRLPGPFVQSTSNRIELGLMNIR